MSAAIVELPPLDRARRSSALVTVAGLLTVWIVALGDSTIVAALIGGAFTTANTLLMVWGGRIPRRRRRRNGEDDEE